MGSSFRRTKGLARSFNSSCARIRRSWSSTSHRILIMSLFGSKVSLTPEPMLALLAVLVMKEQRLAWTCIP